MSLSWLERRFRDGSIQDQVAILNHVVFQTFLEPARLSSNDHLLLRMSGWARDRLMALSIAQQIGAQELREQRVAEVLIEFLEQPDGRVGAWLFFELGFLESCAAQILPPLGRFLDDPSDEDSSTLRCARGAYARLRAALE